jgi:CTP synthase (UTP-ammonia lyase)
LGIQKADHEETSPGAATLLISRLACVIAGQDRTVKLIPGTKSAQAYARDETTEQFRCYFGLNPDFRATIMKEPVQIAGVDENEEVRIVEIAGHPFYIATLFVPQLSSKPSDPHPLVNAYLQAAAEFHVTQSTLP